MMNILAEVGSGAALLMSGYSLWRTSLKQADLRLFVPPLIRYASPYQNSVFEAFEIPLTIINEGARTGTVLSIIMTVTNPRTRQNKQFYSAGVGVWSLPKARGENLEPFTPIALAGRTSQSETILFYAREDSSVQQIVDVAANYQFSLGGLTPKGQASSPLKFEMVLPHFDNRAFTSGSGSLPLHTPDWLPAGDL
jgi:hypothetical protein